MNEERFRNMESLLSTLMDSHVQFHAEMEDIKEVQRKLSESQTRNEAAIRDLIIVSRTVLDQIKGLHQEDEKLREEDEKLREAQRIADEKWREAQRLTDEKLNALIEILDRMIRDRNR